ncbi:uncharacterized protein LOC111798729 [Cucurbita pepo subsp. pepo]|uniref:uncharacterized protein LOC111798729 n=1 Tax=Cucurbita pepo subsp. pepo TaxID=3664 RepID=UPI000C9D3509|nr:uncharacterized protein LOC111798729 [Cucurbita pepo subsp. pepo]
MISQSFKIIFLRGNPTELCFACLLRAACLFHLFFPLNRIRVLVMFCLSRSCPCQGVYLSFLNLHRTCVPKPELTTQTHDSLSLLSFTAFVPSHSASFSISPNGYYSYSPTFLSIPPTPYPNSPPQYPDLYGKRRQTAKVQMLQREIAFLQEDLKSTDGLQPASQCCKEYVHQFICQRL